MNKISYAKLKCFYVNVSKRVVTCNFCLLTKMIPASWLLLPLSLLNIIIALPSTCAASNVQRNFASALKLGDLEKVSSILNTGVVQVNAYSPSGRTPLLLSVEYRKQSIAQLLLERGAEPNTADNDGVTPLWIAAGNGDVEMAQLLLAHGANPNADEAGLTPLHVAASYNFSEMAQLLVAAGADVNKGDAMGQGQTALWLAAEKNFSVMISVLHEIGADCEAASKLGDQPTHVASHFGFNTVLEALKQCGASMVPTNRRGLTPLHVAAMEGHVETAKWLVLKNNVNPNMRTASTGGSALHYAVVHSDIPMIHALLSLGSTIDMQDHTTGWTALHTAAAHNVKDVVKVLLESGANPHIKDNEGMIPLELAKIQKLDGIVALLETKVMQQLEL
jgi:uncharacterized protein